MEFTITESNGKIIKVKSQTLEIKEVIKFHCLPCNRLTNQRKLWGNEIDVPYDENVGFFASTLYELFICQGCDAITFRVTDYNSEDWEEINATNRHLIGHPTYYPKRTERMIRPKVEIFYAPTKVRRIYDETIEAYNNMQLTLCAIGIRAIIEAICIEEGIDVSGLDKKIDELIKRSIVTPKLGGGLQENRLLGNESAHKLEAFGDRQLLAGIRLIENVIEGHYASTQKIDLLKTRKKTRVSENDFL